MLALGDDPSHVYLLWINNKDPMEINKLRCLSMSLPLAREHILYKHHINPTTCTSRCAKRNMLESLIFWYDQAPHCAMFDALGKWLNWVPYINLFPFLELHWIVLHACQSYSYQMASLDHTVEFRARHTIESKQIVFSHHETGSLSDLVHERRHIDHLEILLSVVILDNLGAHHTR